MQNFNKRLAMGNKRRENERRIMCLAIPARIVELDGDNAVVDAMGNRFRAKTTLLNKVKLGDLVLVHAGFAITLVDEEEAKKTWQLIESIDDFEDTSNKISG
jgi:hydrogenase expression/formation protein HypC